MILKPWSKETYCFQVRLSLESSDDPAQPEQSDQFEHAQEFELVHISLQGEYDLDQLEAPFEGNRSEKVDIELTTKNVMCSNFAWIQHLNTSFGVVIGCSERYEDI